MPSFKSTTGSSMSKPPKPIRVWRRENRASSAAMIRSHDRARLKPSPKAAPCTAAITVLSQVSRPGPSVRPFTMPRMRRDWGRRSPFISPKVSTGTRVTSSPEQKCGPVAASTMTLMASSSWAASNLSCSSMFMSGIKMALRRCGRFKVMRAMCSSITS